MSINNNWNLFQKIIYKVTIFVVSLKPLLDISVASPFDLFYVKESRGWIRYDFISLALIKSPRQNKPIWIISLTLWLVNFTYTSMCFSSVMNTLTKKKS